MYVVYKTGDEQEKLKIREPLLKMYYLTTLANCLKIFAKATILESKLIFRLLRNNS